MRVVKQVSDIECANSIRYLLSQSGIPCYLSRADDRRGHLIWVYFDSQIDAARELLANLPVPDSCPVEVDDFLTGSVDKPALQL